MNKAIRTAKQQASTATRQIMTDFKAKLDAIDDAVTKKYDMETNHGRKPTEQADWASKYKQFVGAECKAQGWTN